MGFAVMNLKKVAGNDAPMSAHIERTIEPANADKSRTYLNKELIEFPEGVNNRTEAIQHRIETAGITRKITSNQVRVIRGILTGTHEDMKQIESDGKLDEWCADNLNWLKKTFGTENIVSAVLHMDEKTPHIHASIVPIVIGERRKAKLEQSKTGRKYKTKSTNAPRLCADDVTARDKMIYYQDSYAEAVNKYGLQRGKKGSEARHITTQQYYRELVDKNAELKEDNEILQEQKEEANEELSRIKSEIKTEKLKNSAVNVATSAIEGIGSMFGGSKVKKQQQEIEILKSENVGLQTENQTLKTQIQLKEKEHTTAMEKLRQELDKIYSLFPKIRELLRIEKLCRYLGFDEEHTNVILDMKPFGFSGKLYSSEYQKHFETEHSVAEIKPLLSDPDRLQLTIDGINDTVWFRQKHKEFLEKIGVKINQESSKNKGVKV